MKPEEWDAAATAEAERLNVPSPQHAQRITFEGCEYCLVSPEDYEGIFNALLSAALRERESTKDAERLRDLLRQTQFGLAYGKCPICAGWMVEPNGETHRRHTKTCPVGIALAAGEGRGKL